MGSYIRSIFIDKEKANSALSLGEFKPGEGFPQDYDMYSVLLGSRKTIECAPLAKLPFERKKSQQVIDFADYWGTDVSLYSITRAELEGLDRNMRVFNRRNQSWQKVGDCLRPDADRLIQQLLLTKGDIFHFFFI